MQSHELPDEYAEERVAFVASWKGLYIFILVYFIVQIALLYLFTAAFNKP